MIGRHDGSKWSTDHFSAVLRDTEVATQEGLRCGRPQADDDARSYQFELSFKPRTARSDFPRAGLGVQSALTADDLEGRRPGTPGGQKTVDYLTAQFRKYGLKPGNGDNYVQQVPLVEIRTNADSTLSIGGGRGALLPLRQGTDMVLWTPRPTPAAAR